VVIATPGRAKNCSLLLFSVVFAVAACEFALRLLPVEEDVASKWGRGRVQHFSVPAFAPDPEFGFDAVPGAVAQVTSRHNDELVYNVTYSFDEHGARVAPGARKGDSAIVVTGDSFNFGEGLNDDQTLAYFLQEASNHEFWALNVARPGYGPHQVLRQLELDLPMRDGARSFGWVIMSVVDNHIERASGRYSWMRGSPRYVLERDGGVHLDGVYGDRVVATWRETLRNGSRLFAKGEKIWARFSSSDDERLFAGILHAIHDVAERKYHAHCLVLYHSGAAFLDDLVGRRALMHRLFEQAGVTYIDVNESVPGVDASYFIADDGHPSAKMNAALAGIVLARIGQPQ
jgi:hypothetical protein